MMTKQTTVTDEHHEMQLKMPEKASKWTLNKDFFKKIKQ